MRCSASSSTSFAAHHERAALRRTTARRHIAVLPPGELQFNARRAAAIARARAGKLRADGHGTVTVRMTREHHAGDASWTAGKAATSYTYLVESMSAVSDERFADACARISDARLLPKVGVR